MKKQTLSEEFRRMQKLAGIIQEGMFVNNDGELQNLEIPKGEKKFKTYLNEIKVSTPGINIDNLLWTSELYEFFKNDQDIFKDSKINIIIKQNINKIIDGIWEDYTAIYQQYDIEEFNEGNILDYPKTKKDLLDPNKQTGGVQDAEYFMIGVFLFPYILKHLKQNGWEHAITDDWIDATFSKDGKEVDIFNYITPFEDQDTDPRENLYEKFIDYMEENY